MTGKYCCSHDCLHDDNLLTLTQGIGFHLALCFFSSVNELFLDPWTSGTHSDSEKKKQILTVSFFEHQEIYLSTEIKNLLLGHLMITK